MLAPRYHPASIKPPVILDPQAKKSSLLHRTPTPYGELASDWEVGRSAVSDAEGKRQRDKVVREVYGKIVFRDLRRVI